MDINATLLGQAISFFLFVVFCMKYVWPPIIKAIEERQKSIADALSSAERANKSLELAKSQASDQLKEVKIQAAEIIEQANKRKAQIIEEAATLAKIESNKILDQGRADLALEKNRAKDELRKQLAALAVIGAERILERQIDQAANNDIVEKLVAEL